MSKLILFNPETNHKINPISLKKELEIQTLVEKNCQEIFDITILETEYPFYDYEKGNGRMDTIGIDKDYRPVVIEYKLGQDENHIKQITFYLDWLQNHKDAFENLVLKKLGKTDAEKIKFKPRGICIARDYDSRDKILANTIKLDITLFKYQVYSDGRELVTFEIINDRETTNNESKKDGCNYDSNSFKEDFKNKSLHSLTEKPKTPSVNEPTTTIVNYQKNNSTETKTTYNAIYQNFNQEMKEIVNTIDHFILTNFEQANVSIIKNSRNYKRNHTFCDVSIWDENIYLWLKLKWSDDYQDKYQAIDYTEKNAHNKDETRCNVKISLSSLADFEQVKPLLKTAYEEN